MLDGMNHIIYSDDGQVVGRLRDWCCGVDFVPEGKNCLFSIIRLRRGKDNFKILDCVKEIVRLPLSELRGHYNYRHVSHRQESFDEIKAWFEEKATE